MGDFNINLLDNTVHVPAADFIESLYSYSFFQLITKPTRVQSNSATLIDNLYCNNIANLNMTNGILYTDISDHFPVFCMSNYIETLRVQNTKKSRIFSNANIAAFKESLIMVMKHSLHFIMNTVTYMTRISQ